MAVLVEPESFTRMEIKSPADGSWVEVDSMRTHVIGFDDKTWLRISFMHRGTDYDELLNYETVLSGAFWSKGRFVTTGMDLACTSSILGFAISGHKDVKSAWISAVVKKIKYKESDRDWLCEVVWQMEKMQYRDFGPPVNIWLSVKRREIRLPGRVLPLDHPIIAKWLHCMAEVMGDEEQQNQQTTTNVQSVAPSRMAPRNSEFTSANPRRSSRQKGMKRVCMREDDGGSSQLGESDENEGDVANMVGGVPSPRESGSSKDPNTGLLYLLCDAAEVNQDRANGGGGGGCGEDGARKSDGKMAKSKKATATKASASKTPTNKCGYDDAPKQGLEDVSSRKRKQQPSPDFAAHKCVSCASIPRPVPPHHSDFRAFAPGELVVSPSCQHHGYIRAGFRRPDDYTPPPMMPPLPPLPSQMAYLPSPAPAPPPPQGLRRAWPPVHFRPSHPIPVHIRPCVQGVPYNWYSTPSHLPPHPRRPHLGVPVAGVPFRHCPPRQMSSRVLRGNELQIISMAQKPPTGIEDEVFKAVPR